MGIIKKPLLLSLLSAVLLSAGWLGFTGLVLAVAMVPLLYISDGYSRSRRDFWKMFGWLAIALGIWSGITTWWIWYAAPIGAILSVLITIGLFGGMFMLFHFVSKRAPKALAYTLLVAGWIACEYLYTVGEVSFPWLTLGNGFANDPAFVQWYDTTGVFGGTLWVWVVNIAFLFAIKGRGGKRWALPAAFMLVPAAVSLLKYFAYEETGRDISITVVQPNIEPYTEKFVLSQDEQTDILLSLARQAPLGSDYIVMPETAIDDGIWEHSIDNNRTIEQIRELARDEYPGTDFIVGATTYRRYLPGEKISSTARTREHLDYYYDIYNTAIAVDTSRNSSFHHKSILVVGVEKMPYYAILKHLEFLIVDLGGTTGQLGVDSVRAVFTASDGKRSAAAICYESLYGQYYSEFVRNGAEVMFIITNDGWWRDTWGHRQHFSYARLRAIETRRSIARSANTGISGFIDQKGRVLQTAGWDIRTTLSETLKTNGHITFYTKYGDYVARICCYIFGLCMLYFVAYTFKRRNNLDTEKKRKEKNESKGGYGVK